MQAPPAPVARAFQASGTYGCPRYPPTLGLPVPRRHLRPHPADLGPGELAHRRAGPRGRHVRNLRRGAARRIERHHGRAAGVEWLRRPARTQIGERQPETAARRRAGCAAGAARARRSVARARAAARDARPIRSAHGGSGDHRRGRDARFPHADDRQGDARRAAPRHGGDRAGRRRRAHRHAAGAIIERSRAQGVVVGSGEDRLRMENVSEASDIVVGDIVVTSGIEGIYPKGFIIGRVDTVEKNGPSYRTITVKPAVDFASLEEVLVVVTPTPAREAPGEAGGGRE
ncbi:MAG: hypothetical protein DMG03_06885 [Acidobacteria bacterium]|nr:MAG: hypothetical protein DMG03_06885 [Acidobacteriota bacterium]